LYAGAHSVIVVNSKIFRSFPSYIHILYTSHGEVVLNSVVLASPWPKTPSSFAGNYVYCKFVIHDEQMPTARVKYFIIVYFGFDVCSTNYGVMILILIVCTIHGVRLVYFGLVRVCLSTGRRWSVMCKWPRNIFTLCQMHFEEKKNHCQCWLGQQLLDHPKCVRVPTI